MPLNPILSFEKLDINFVGPIKLLGHYGRKHYILVVSQYVTKWAEIVATKIDDAEIVAKFIYENIKIYFGCLKKLGSDRGTHFISYIVKHLIN